MHTLLKMLQGGDRRSIGRSGEVVTLVLAQPELLEILMAGMDGPDPLVSMRCADAAEKVTALHPEYLVPYKQMLVDELSQIGQKEVRWHVAAMLPRLPLTENERHSASSIYCCLTLTTKASRYFCESLFWASQPNQAAKA